MNTAQQTVETEQAAAAGLPPKRKPFNYYPLLGVALTIVCAVVIYGGVYYLMK